MASIQCLNGARDSFKLFFSTFTKLLIKLKPNHISKQIFHNRLRVCCVQQIKSQFQLLKAHFYWNNGNLHLFLSKKVTILIQSVFTCWPAALTKHNSLLIVLRELPIVFVNSGLLKTLSQCICTDLTSRMNFTMYKPCVTIHDSNYKVYDKWYKK